MKLRKISLLLMIIVLSFMISGCSSTEEKEVNNNSNSNGNGTPKQKIVADDFNEDGSGKLKCSQEVNAEEGLKVDLSYTIEYKRGNILNLRSISRVTGSNNEQLNKYEEAYRSIAANYKGLEQYITRVVRDSNSVTYDATINYDKIDIGRLLEIEGEEDNIIVGKKAKLALWLELAGKVGVVCEEV